MTKKHKPSGKYSKVSSILRFTIKTDKEISRKEVKSMFDRERKNLLEYDDTKSIARAMSFDSFVNTYLTEAEAQVYFDCNFGATTMEFVQEKLDDYTYELERK